MTITIAITTSRSSLPEYITQTETQTHPAATAPAALHKRAVLHMVVLRVLSLMRSHGHKNGNGRNSRRSSHSLCEKTKTVTADRRREAGSQVESLPRHSQCTYLVGTAKLLQ